MSEHTNEPWKTHPDVWLRRDGSATLARIKGRMPIGYLTDAAPIWADGKVTVQLTGEAALMYGAKPVRLKLHTGKP